MNRIPRALMALAITALATLTVASPASAADDQPIPVESDCIEGWYVNPDEGALLPEQTEDGLLFDGPSLVHHQTNYTLATLPIDGAFVADVQVGVAPLFKVETAPPAYSTINKTAAGKWWSSKIAASDPGGQSNPVDSPADLIGLWNYTGSTVVFSFGVGYANDIGNTAVVSSIIFAGVTYDLTCEPQATPTVATSSTGANTSTSAGGQTLPTTGSSLMPVLVTAAILIVGGAGLLAGLAVRRRHSAR